MLKLAKRTGTRDQRIGSTGPRAGLEAQLKRLSEATGSFHRQFYVGEDSAALSNCRSSGTLPRAFRQVNWTGGRVGGASSFANTAEWVVLHLGGHVGMVSMMAG